MKNLILVLSLITSLFFVSCTSENQEFKDDQQTQVESNDAIRGTYIFKRHKLKFNSNTRCYDYTSRRNRTYTQSGWGWWRKISVTGLGTMKHYDMSSFN